MISHTSVQLQAMSDPDSMPPSRSHGPSAEFPSQPPNHADVLNGGDHGLLQLLSQVTLRLRLRGAELESSTGLSGRELDLIALLGASGPTSVKNLVADLGLPRSTMTAIVDRLETRGLIKRLPNPQDRRSVILEATPSASEALLRFREGMSSLVQHLKAVLRQDEQEQFAHLIQKIHGSF